MFGKLFASTFTGSMAGAGPHVISVWAYIVAHTVDSTVELNPALVGGAIGMSREQVDTAIAWLCAPDAHSRNSAFDGSRLVKEGAFQYYVVSHALYRNLRNEAERRAYNRDKQRASRQRKALPQADLTGRGNSSNLPRVSAHTEAEAEAETEAEAEASAQRSRFARPASSGLNESRFPRAGAEEDFESRGFSRKPKVSSLDTPSKRDRLLGGARNGLLEPTQATKASEDPDPAHAPVADAPSSPEASTRLVELNSLIAQTKERTRKASQDRFDSDAAKAKKLANLGGKTKPASQRKQLQNLERIWRGCLSALVPGIKIAAWEGRESGQVLSLVKKYGEDLTGLSIDYVVRNWETIRSRFLKGTGGIPSIGFVLRFHEVLVPEAQQWTEVKLLKEAIDRWTQENPHVPTLPQELSAKVRELGPQAKALGLTL